jgi:hypothetical protein
LGSHVFTLSNDLIAIERCNDNLFVLDNRGLQQIVYTIEDYIKIKFAQSRVILKIPNLTQPVTTHSTM